MKFRIDRTGFADAVHTVARRLPSRPVAPILAGVKLDTTDNMLTVSGFDYEVSTVVHVQADTLDAGTVIVSGKLLADITKALPQKPVEVTVDGSTMRIVCGTAKFSLPTLVEADYPALPNFPRIQGGIDPDVFTEIMSQVGVAAGKDDSLPMLTGVRFESTEGELTVAATDRFRLAVRQFDWFGEDAEVLVPAKTIVDIAKSLQPSDGRIGIGFENGLFGAAFGNVKITSRLLDAEFPKFRQLIPTEHTSVALVEIEQLVDAIKRVALVAERGAQVRLSFTEGQVTVSAGGSDAGSAEESLPIDYAGGDITIGFNPGYLLDGLHTITVERVLFGFSTPARPATLRPYDGSLDLLGSGTEFVAPNTDFVYLLMPVRLAN